jgi:YHS domain-containing protein
VVAASNAARENVPDADFVLGGPGFGEPNIDPQTFIVASAQGEQDEGALALAFSTEAGYIAVKAGGNPPVRRQSNQPRLGQTRLGEEMSENTPKKAIDPICGMSVETATAAHTSEYKGKRFYFCCAGCKQKFDQQPEKYASRGQA